MKNLEAANGGNSELETSATSRLGMALLGARVDKLDEKDATQLTGMSGYLLPFEIVSVHLLVVLIGSAYLARPKKRVRTTAGGQSF